MSVTLADTVLAAAFTAMGPPQPDPGHPVGRCARCARTAELRPVREAVSAQFTGFDDWRCASGSGLCPVCVWGYRSAALRREAHLVTRHPPECHAVQKPAVFALLSAGAVGPGQCLVVPVRPGRKHVMPTAVWGQVCTDTANLPWSAGDAGRLAAVGRLRRWGFGPRLLVQAAPAFAAVRRLEAQKWAQVFHTWEQVDPWRAGGQPWLEVAIWATAGMGREAL